MNAGLSFIPVGNDKKPWIRSWEEYQYRRPEPDEIQDMNFRDAPGVAIICGDVSGGVEVIDFDTKNDPKGTIWREFGDLAKEKKIDDILRNLTIQSTKSGGYHILYKCPKPGRSEKLAVHDSGKPIIETRGNGGYVVTYPTDRYQLLQGDITNIQSISQGERDRILEVCKMLNRKDAPQPLAKVFQINNRTKNKLTATVEKICKQIEQAQVDITADYTAWVKVGHGIAHHFGEDGRQFFHRVSQFHPEYNINDTNKKYDHLLLQKSKYRHATIKSFLAIARDYGVDIRDPENHDSDKVSQWVKKQALRYNMVTNRIEDAYGEPLDDFVLNQLWLDCRTQTESKVSRQVFDSHVFNYDHLETYNPITEYFDQLLIRDVDHKIIDTFLSHLRLQDTNWMPFIRKWLLSVVASAYGNPSELILVLLGPQHNGKTEFFLRLLPDELRKYFAVDKLDQGKDSDILMSQKLIILDDEFAGKSKKDAKHLKALASRRSFSVRMPYGRVSKDLPRLAVLCGASNLEDVINDNTGNRRIIPVVVESRDYELADGINRNDLWAALVQEYFNPENEEGWFLTSEEVSYIKEMSEGFQSTNMERELIVAHFRPGTEYDDFYTASEIVDTIMEKHPSAKIWPVKVGQELSQLGFQRICRRVDGLPKWGYYARYVVDDSQFEKKHNPEHTMANLRPDDGNLPF